MTVLDLFKLTGKTAIVTGGGRGLGAQIARGFAEAGANVVLCSRNVEACSEMSKELEALGVRSIGLACDVTKQQDVKRVVEETMEIFGTIDILVNNSGATWGAPVVDMPYEAWKKVMDVNVNGTFLMSQEVGKVMIEQGSGKIINIASVAGLGGRIQALWIPLATTPVKGQSLHLRKISRLNGGNTTLTSMRLHPDFSRPKCRKSQLNKGMIIS